MTYLKKNLKFIFTLGGNFNGLINLIREENAGPLKNITEEEYLKRISKYQINSESYSFGSKNKDKKFYIIKRSPGAGFFSNVNYVLHDLLICKKFNYIPVIDMKNFKTIYNEDNKIYNSLNAWEYYFKRLNKYKLEEVYKSKNVIIPSQNTKLKFDISNKIFENFKKKININSQIKNYSNSFLKKNFTTKDKVLGIHLRGTSYKTASGHALPPTAEIMSEFIDDLIRKYNYNKLFLVTEEKEYLNFFIKKYSKLCVFINVYRSYKNDAFLLYPRKNHRYLLGKETLQEALILSKCDGLAYIKSNLISASIFFSKKKQIKHPIFLGFNSRSRFISRWFWHIKKLLPKNYGGLKIISKKDNHY
jgi:hypothetical protein